jgi:TolB-like protein
MIHALLGFLFIPILIYSQTQPVKPRIAVLPVDIVLTEDANGRQIVDKLTQEIALELAKRGRYEVLPPVQTRSVKDTIMNSDERWRHASMQPDDVQLVGTALGAGYVITGSLTRTGKKYLYHAWFYKTDGGKVLASDNIEYSNLDEGLTLARLLAGWLLNEVEPLDAPAPVNTAGASSSYTTAPTSGATLSTAPPAGTAAPWASVVTLPSTTPLPIGAGPVVTAPTGSQPLVSASADSPTSVVINIAPGPEAAAVPAAAAAAPLVFNNNNNNNNNLGGGGGQQQQMSSSPPLFIMMPQEEKPAAPAPVPEPPPPEIITETITETVEVEVETQHRQLLYAGVRGGIHLRQYTIPQDAVEEDPIPYTSLNAATTSGSMELEGAVFFGIQVVTFLALQVDVMWVSNDITAVDDDGEPTARYQTMFSPTINLLIGAQLKFTFWLGQKVLLAPFGAFYYSMMPSGITYTAFGDNEEGVLISAQVAAGVISVGAGLTLGFKMGPGELFLEGKALIDMTATRLSSSDDDGLPLEWDAYKRSVLPSFTLGYQFRFMNLKSRAKPETAAK